MNIKAQRRLSTTSGRCGHRGSNIRYRPEADIRIEGGHRSATIPRDDPRRSIPIADDRFAFMLRVMAGDVFGKIGRGFGWIGVTAISLLLAGVIGILPLSLLPGSVHTDFVHGQWIKIAWIVLVGAILSWRLSPMNRNVRLSPQAAGMFIWLTVTAFMLAFWPAGLAIWFNAYNSKVASVHDMAVLGMESTTVRPAVTPVESYELRDLSTGWAANLEVTEKRKQFVVPGRCVRIVVRTGRLGLDWISDAEPIPCPANGS